NDVAALLGKAGVNMTAFSLADNSDFGILRVIVSDPHKAQEVLKAQKFAVSLTDVIHLQIANTPGSLSNVLAVLADAGMYIEYMYAFSEGNRANVIIKPDNVPNAVEALQAHKIM
ncbi:MAG TPA: amino acid-binding protein, partial [Paludibacteraceae bacterium]|nr:amino acid-binding protein [Paludibacteraceae bacterium]